MNLFGITRVSADESSNQRPTNFTSGQMSNLQMRNAFCSASANFGYAFIQIFHTLKKIVKGD